MNEKAARLSRKIAQKLGTPERYRNKVERSVARSVARAFAAMDHRTRGRRTKLWRAILAGQVSPYKESP